MMRTDFGDEWWPGEADGGSDGGGPLGRERDERRKREEREEEESWRRFKHSTSHANRTGATSAHMSQGGWATSRATAGGVTQSCQPD
jgi:hypothetical protein